MLRQGGFAVGAGEEVATDFTPANDMLGQADEHGFLDADSADFARLF